MTIFYEKGWYSDVTLQINGKKYRLHKKVLSVESEFFRVLFNNEEKMNVSDEIKIVDCHQSAIPSYIVDEMIKWFYHSNLTKIEIKKPTIDYYYLYCCADFLHVPTMKRFCLEKIKKDLEEYSRDLSLLSPHEEKNLYKYKHLFEYLRANRDIYDEVNVRTVIFDAYIRGSLTFEHMIDYLNDNTDFIRLVNRVVSLLYDRKIYNIPHNILSIEEALKIASIIEKKQLDLVIQIIDSNDFYEGEKIINHKTATLEAFCIEYGLVRSFNKKLQSAINLKSHILLS